MDQLDVLRIGRHGMPAMHASAPTGRPGSAEYARWAELSRLRAEAREARRIAALERRRARLERRLRAVESRIGAARAVARPAR